MYVWANRALYYKRALPYGRSACAAIAAIVLYYQLFAPGFAGLADNGDFPRLAGHLSLCPTTGWDAYRFRSFVPTYLERPSCYWDSEIPTGSHAVARSVRVLFSGPEFDIRQLAAFYSVALIALIAAWPPLLLFCDLANTAYFNSFYLDALPLLALLAVALCARKMLRATSVVTIACFTIASLLLVSSKLQHATCAFPFILFLAWRIRWRAVVPAGLLLGTALWMSFATPVDYKTTNMWNSVFVSLAPKSPTALADLNLSPAYEPFIGRNAYEFPDPAAARYWLDRLHSEMSYRAIAGYYLAHPALAWERALDSARGLQHVRPDYLGNTPPGTAAYTQSGRVAFYSSAKAWCFGNLPYLAIAIYLGAASTIPRPLALLFAAMAAIEFLTSTFADSVLDYRHHTMLHQIGDLWLLSAIPFARDSQRPYRQHFAIILDVIARRWNQ